MDSDNVRMMKLEIQNYMNIRALTIEPNGRSVVLRGKNGTGKTSGVSALWSTLAGKAAADTPELIHRG